MHLYGGMRDRKFVSGVIMASAPKGYGFLAC